MAVLWLPALLLSTIALAHVPESRHSPTPSKPCPPFVAGNFTLHRFQLYPENALWDPVHCIAYFSVLFNGSVAFYNPYTTDISILSFPGITHEPGAHSSGLHFDPAVSTSTLSVVLNHENPFLTGGANVAGDNFLVKYDVDSQRELWRVNLTATTGGKWSGFQDVGVDTKGNSYVTSTYPKSVLKVDKHGREVTVWYPPPEPLNTTIPGYGGAVSFGDVLLVHDARGGSVGGTAGIYRFDLTEKRGRPVRVPHIPDAAFGGTSKIHLPPMYGGKVLLLSEDLVGVHVLRSRDGRWERAEYLGVVRSEFPKLFERIISTTVQLGRDKQYMVGQFFPGQIVPGTGAGNHSDFPMFDITERVAALLAG